MLVLDARSEHFTYAELDEAVKTFAGSLFVDEGDEPDSAWWQITHAAADAEQAGTESVIREATKILEKAPKGKIQRAIESGDIAGAVALFPWREYEKALFEGFDEIFQRIQTRSGADTAVEIGKDLDFDETTTAKFFRRGARVAASRVAKSSRRAIMTAIRRLLGGNLISAFQMRVQIFILLGLDPIQANAAVNLLEAGVEASKTLKDLEEASQLFADEKRDVRAEMIARFENLNVAQAAQEEAVEQAIEVKAIKNIVKIWVVTPDERLCPICDRLRGQRQIKDKMFKDPLTGLTYIGPPAHQRCRCGLRYVQARRSEAAGVFVIDIRVPDDSATAARDLQTAAQFHLAGKHDQKRHGGGKGREATTPCPPVCLKPNPFADKDRNGITDQCRVGVAPGSIPDEIPNLPNLTKEERAAEQRFSDAYEADPGAMSSAYRQQVAAHSENGNTFNTDDAKMLSGDYNNGDPAAKAFYNEAVHQTANATAKRAFSDHLEANAGLPDSEKIIVVTSGGVAAGKGFSVKQSTEISAQSKKATAVWDAAGEQNATENEWVLEEARKHGYKVNYVYVHADPNTSWQGTKDRGGAVTRATKKGRMVNETLFAESYELGAKNFEGFASKHGGSADVSISYFDNATGGLPVRVNKMPSSALKFKSSTIKKKSATYIDNEFADGDIPAYVHRGGTNSRRIWPD